MGPIDYTVSGVPDPQQQFLQGIQAGNALEQMQVQRAQQAAALQQQQQMKQTLQALALKPGVTGADYARVMTMYPQLSEHLKRASDTMTADQQASTISHSGQVLAAMRGGQNDLAAQLAEQRATAAENAGLKDQAQAARNLAAQIKTDPQGAQAGLMTFISAIPGGDKVITGLGQIGTEQRAADKAPVELRTAVATAQEQEAKASVAQQRAQEEVRGLIWGNADKRSQIEERAARLGLDRDKLTSETQLKLTELNQKFGQLPDDARTLVNGSAVAAASAEQAVNQYQNLAARLDKEVGVGSGKFSGISEWMKTATGSQDALTGLRQEYTRIMSQGVVKSLPPGPASDKDIALAREGFPPATADAAYLASFLRGMAKLSAYDAALNNAKAEWAGNVQHLGKSKTDIEIGGVKVPAGTTFNEFVTQFMAKRADDILNAATVGQRGYMKYATPQTGGATGAY